jgi:4-amino-4-deoxy-L-arabinose transferase-like glycosyltransferase
MGKGSRKKRERALERAAAIAGAAAAPATWDPASPASDEVPPQPWWDLWRDHRIPAIAIFAVAFAVRAAALWFIVRSPYHEVSNIDSDAYLKWANDILTLGWIPSRGFYQSPLYAYWLALVFKVGGAGVLAPRVIQIVIGSVSSVLVYTIATRLFTRRAGWIAGLGLAVYGPLILEEITLSKTTLLVFSVLLSFAIFLRYAPAARLRGIAAAGLLFGVSVIGVGQWLPAFLIFGIYSGFVVPGLTLRRRAITSAVFLTAGLVVVGPMVVWNSVHGAGLVVTSGDAGLNFYEGNNERASALPARPPGLRDIPKFEEDDSRRIAEQETGKALGPAGVSAFWTRKALDFIAGHPGDYLALLGKKLRALANTYEIPDNYHYAFVRDHFVPLFWGCLTFGVVAPFAILGMAFRFWRRRTVLAMAVLCFSYLATLLLFYVRSRYRLPAVPFLLVFAAVAVERIIGWIQARDWNTAAIGGMGLAAAAVFVNVPYCEPPHHGFREVCLGGDTWYDQEWMKLGAWYEDKGDLDQAVLYVRAATECSSPRGPGQTWYWLASLEQRQGDAFLAKNERDAARAHFEGAVRAYQQCLELKYRRLNAIYFNLITVYGRLHLADRVTAAIDEAVQAGAIDRGALLLIAKNQAQAGNCADAKIVLVRADRSRGSSNFSDEARAILVSCVPH